MLLLMIACLFTGCKGTEGLILTGEAALNEESCDADKYLTQESLLTEGSSLSDDGSPEKKAEQGKEASCEATIFVHICGAVAKPGVYELPNGARVFQAVESAGGFLKEADETYLNQAQVLTDGMQLYIPTKEEVEKAEAEGKSLQPERVGTQTKDSSLININTADIEQLCTLPGIGSAKAADIIAYRETNGSFLTIQDIMKVDGIKEGMFSKIKDKICV